MENRLTYPSIAYPNPANIPTPARSTAGHAISAMGMATIASTNPPIEYMLAMRADWTTGSHSLSLDDSVIPGDARGAVTAFTEAAAAWRATLLAADDAALSTVGWSTYPNGSDPEDVFIDTVWWVNQEVLHHGAEIALLRDLYRAR